MKHLRSDYDCIQPFPVKRAKVVKIDGEKVNVEPESPDHIRSLGRHMDPIVPDDEPVFLLRAQDPSSYAAVLAWARDVEQRGGDPVLVSRVRDWAEGMAAWRLAHHPDKAVADVPDGALR